MVASAGVNLEITAILSSKETVSVVSYIDMSFFQTLIFLLNTLDILYTIYSRTSIQGASFKSWPQRNRVSIIKGILSALQNATKNSTIMNKGAGYPFSLISPVPEGEISLKTLFRHTHTQFIGLLILRGRTMGVDIAIA